MKKLFKLVCSLGMCLSLVACSGSKVDDDAIQAFIDATAKLAEMDSVSYDVSLQGNDGTQDMSVKVYGDLLTANEKYEMSLLADLTSQGQTMNKFAEFYVVDNMQYLSFMGMKQKQPVAEEVAQVETLTTAPLTDLITVDMIKPYLTSASKDGDTIKFVLDMEKIAEVDSTKESMSKSTYGEFTIEMQVTDGFLSSIKATGDATETSTEKKVTFEMNIALKNINGVKSITFPDFSEYTTAEELPF